MAKIHIENQSYEVDPAKNLLQISLSLGFDLPYFCWHPALGSVGACRQCAVKLYRDEHDQRGMIVMACMIPALDKTRFSINDPEAREFRKSVIEWLMVNHPHDCPVCDEGGECHLQDMTVMTGHAYRRFRFKKRTYNNQYLGPFINHEMNRCIQCYRCVRYYKDYAGGTDLDVFSAHDHVYFGRHEEGVLESEFSGNLVEVCPTGVFTDKTLKSHYTRKWDLQSAPSVCVHCGLGCNTLAGARYGGVRRILNRFNSQVNGYFLCDRGRFGYEHVNHANRIRSARLRERDDRNERDVEPVEAITWLKGRAQKGGGVIGIGSPRASLESNYALRRLVGPEHFFHGVADREYRILTAIVEILRRGPVPAASLGTIEKCDAILVLGEDVLNTAPRLALSLRQSVRQQPLRQADALHIARWHDKAVRDALQDDKGPLFIATPARTGLDGDAREVLRAAPQAIAGLGFAAAHAIAPGAPASQAVPDETRQLAGRIAEALIAAERPLIVAGTSLGSLELVHAAANVAQALHRAGRKPELCFVTAEPDSLGIALLGGRDLSGATEAAAGGSVSTAIILENDLYRRLDRDVADRFLAAVPEIVVLDHLTNATTRHADLVLPAATFAEADGTFVNNEGQAQRFFQVLAPHPVVRESWRWLDQANPEGRQWRNLDEITAELERSQVLLRGIVDAAPLAHMRANGQKFPRESQRFSGRTAIHANVNIHEQRPPEDADSPLAFSMEGFPGQPPAALITRYWSAGWNSVQALGKFQHEVGGSLRDGDSGRRLIEPSGAPDISYFEPEAVDEAATGEGELLVVPIHAIFGSDELSMQAPAVAERSSQHVLLINPADAAARGLATGGEATLRIGAVECRLPVELREDLPAGVAGYPAGRPGLPFFDLPSPGRLT